MLELINESNSHIFDELAQDYEDEFSATSGKKKNQDGKYSIDVDWRTPNVGYYWKEGSKIVGFSIVESIDGYSEIVDFYVVPAYRKKMVGKNMAFAVFNQHSGLWRVRQSCHQLSFSNGQQIYLNPLLSVNDTNMMISCALQGLGFIKLPQLEAEEHLSAGTLVEMLAEFRESAQSIYIGYSQEKYLQPKVRHFIEFYLEKLKEESAYVL